MKVNLREGILGAAPTRATVDPIRDHRPGYYQRCTSYHWVSHNVRRKRYKLSVSATKLLQSTSW